jgi:hypothetical protein
VDYFGDELTRCGICGARLTRAWIDNVYQVVCSNQEPGRCCVEEKRRQQRELLLRKLIRDGFIKEVDDDE